MTRRVVSSRAADDDIAGAVEYYREVADVDTAATFVDAVEEAVTRIAAFPSSGSARAEAQTGIAGLRIMSVDGFPQVLFYTCDDDAVRIHRVLHDGRDARGEFGD